jgi:hypothetical protein
VLKKPFIIKRFRVFVRHHFTWGKTGGRHGATLADPALTLRDAAGLRELEACRRSMDASCCQATFPPYTKDISQVAAPPVRLSVH